MKGVVGPRHFLLPLGLAVLCLGSDGPCRAPKLQRDQNFLSIWSLGLWARPQRARVSIGFTIFSGECPRLHLPSSLVLPRADSYPP